jgi:hypothetical protein
MRQTRPYDPDLDRDRVSARSLNPAFNLLQHTREALVIEDIDAKAYLITIPHSQLVVRYRRNSRMAIAAPTA